MTLVAFPEASEAPKIRVNLGSSTARNPMMHRTLLGIVKIIQLLSGLAEAFGDGLCFNVPKEETQLRGLTLFINEYHIDIIIYIHMHIHNT